MSELAEPLRRVLGETGYFGPDGRPAASTVTICNGDEPRRGTFKPDVRYHLANLNVDFKFEENPAPEDVDTWQREKWNEGSVPLLWIVEPHQTTLYNGFATPEGAVSARQLDTFNNDLPTHKASTVPPSLGLPELNARAGFLSMETGRFWQEEDRVNRKHAVDARLLREMAQLESDLRGDGLSAERAQGLIGRTIFAQYLVDRGVITKQRLKSFQRRDGERLRRDYGTGGLPGVLEDRGAAERLFGWLSDRFNGDMFPSTGIMPATAHLKHVAAFLRGEATGQGSLFPYRFDLIPVELISAIYEQFVHSADRGKTNPQSDGVYYTPLAAVSLILDQVMEGITGKETVLDITCGSGVFLVEALRRLVEARVGSGERTRKVIREVLYKQIYGVDISPAAIQVAAFSLYLAALELDPAPHDAQGIKFRPLVRNTLLVGDAHSIDSTPAGRTTLRTARGRKQFDLIVGNPPFTERRDRGKVERTDSPQPPADRSLVFAQRARDFSHEETRFGLILRATPFFSRGAGRDAAQDLVESVSPVTIVNLSSCSSWLFRRANVPVVVVTARCRSQQPARHMNLVQAHWSPAGRAGHQFDITSGDVCRLNIASWKRNADLFKAGFLGTYNDLLLLDRLHADHQTLASQLIVLGAKFSEGLKIGGSNRSEDASLSASMPPRMRRLQGLPFWQSQDIEPFRLRQTVEPFVHRRAQRPREPEIYRAPLLVVREFMEPMNGRPRALAAVSDRDGVFTNSYYGATLPNGQDDVGHLLAAILSSALASWYFLMSGSTFGLWAQRLLLQDLVAMPVPKIENALRSSAGVRLVSLAKELADATAQDVDDWAQLDDAVYDLYALGEQERLVVRDGHDRASWQWQRGWKSSVQPASREELEAYADAFIGTVNPWLVASGRRAHAAVLGPSAANPLGAVRFAFDHEAMSSPIEHRRWHGSLGELLTGVDEQIARSFADLFSKHKVLRVPSDGGVLIVKPATRRHWLQSVALMDARRVLESSMRASSDAR